MPKGPGIPVLRKCHDENENVYIKICYCFVCCFSKAFLLLCRCLLARHQTLTRVYSAYRGEPGKLTGWKGAAAAVFAWNNRTKMHKHKQPIDSRSHAARSGAPSSQYHQILFPVSCPQEWSAILTVAQPPRRHGRWRYLRESFWVNVRLLSSCRGPQSALKCSYCGDSVTRG